MPILSTSRPIVNPELASAFAAVVKSAGRAAQRQYRNRDALVVETKSLQDFVSNADRDDTDGREGRALIERPQKN